MPSSNKTQNYDLNQYIGTDLQKRLDYNSDMEKIDTALKGLEDNKENKSQKGIPSGYAGLNGQGTVYPSQLPISTDNTMAGNSDTMIPSQKAVASYVLAKIAALINSAPGVLDTLNEIAAALGNDPNFAATMTTELSKKVNNSDMSATKTANKGAIRDTNGNIDGVRNIIQVKAVTRATTVPNTLAAIDGYIPSPGDLILIASYNGQVIDGIYEVKASGTTWTRATVYDTEGEILNSDILVLNGTKYQNTSWKCVNVGTITLDTTVLQIQQDLRNVLKYEPRNQRTSRLLKTENILTQYSNTNPDVAPIITGSQHFVLQMTTDSFSGADESNAYGAMLALNYDTASPRMALRTFNPSNYSSWKTVAMEDQLLGVGQTWQYLTTSRAGGVTYTNSTGKPIQVSIGLSVASGGDWSTFIVNGVQQSKVYTSTGASGHLDAIVPPGATYVLNRNSATLDTWAELR